MTLYSRRSNCEGASGSGVWIEIMELIAILCIPVNTAIIFFTGNGI